jgi:hypothetical protein
MNEIAEEGRQAQRRSCTEDEGKWRDECKKEADGECRKRKDDGAFGMKFVGEVAGDDRASMSSACPQRTFEVCTLLLGIELCDVVHSKGLVVMNDMMRKMGIE